MIDFERKNSVLAILKMLIICHSVVGHHIKMQIKGLNVFGELCRWV